VNKRIHISLFTPITLTEFLFYHRNYRNWLVSFFFLLYFVCVVCLFPSSARPYYIPTEFYYIICIRSPYFRKYRSTNGKEIRCKAVTPPKWIRNDPILGFGPIYHRQNVKWHLMISVFQFPGAVWSFISEILQQYRRVSISIESGIPQTRMQFTKQVYQLPACLL
jgi:hypothetical protein